MMNFNEYKVAVIGDIMLDKYIHGTVERISPEAPIPILQVKRENNVLGGAANVASNIVSLGAKAYLFGVCGMDEAGEILMTHLKNNGVYASGVHEIENVQTIQKIRLMGQSQQLLRVDYESSNYSNTRVVSSIVKQLKKIESLSAIIVSDYAKGTINKELMDEIREFSLENGIKIFVDPKPQNKELYNDVFLITPNFKEAEGLCNDKLDTNQKIDVAGQFLLDKYNSNIVITRGASGMSIFEKGGEKRVHISTKAKQVFDVSGAGDTVIATLCLSIIAGYDLTNSANIANHAAGIKVSKLGTSTVSLIELNNSLKED